MIKLSPTQIARATNRTIEEWQEAHKMPPLAFILERAYAGSYAEVADDAPRILNRPALPGHVETRNERGDFAKQVIAEMHAKIEAGANAMPSAKPDDPEQLKVWATRMAKKQGWVNPDRDPESSL
jgi:hypothetical protein